MKKMFIFGLVFLFLISFTSGATVEVLVVGSGGAGATATGGGGGAGEISYDASHTVLSQAYSVLIGDGATPTQSSGQSSQFNTITSVGGATGGTFGVNGNNGGNASGGGGGWYGTTGGTGAYSGGDGENPLQGTSSNRAGGGGGGSSANGANGSITGVGGIGGAGTSYSISGSPTDYAGGGGGSGGTTGGSGSAGGGTGASGNSGQSGTDATDNTGSGGGAGGTVTGGDGGSGIVIISYATDGSDGVDSSSTGGTKTTSGGNTIHTFTANGTFTAVTSATTKFKVTVTNNNVFNVSIDGSDYSTTNGTITTTVDSDSASLYDINVTAVDYIDRVFENYNVSTNLVFAMIDEKSVNVTFFDYINISDELYLNSDLTIGYHFFNCPANQTVDFYTSGVLNRTTIENCTGSDVFTNITYSAPEGYFNTSFDGEYQKGPEIETYSFDGLNFTADYTAPSVEFLQSLNTTSLTIDMSEFFNVTDVITNVSSCSIYWDDIDSSFSWTTNCSTSWGFPQAGVFNITITAKDLLNNTNITTSSFQINPYNYVTFYDGTSGDPFGNISINLFYPDNSSLPYTTNSTGTISIPSVKDGHVQSGDYIFSFPDQQGFITPINFTESIDYTDMPYDLEYNLSRANLTILIRDAVNNDLITDNMSVAITGIGQFYTSSGSLTLENITLVSGTYAVYVFSDNYTYSQRTFIFTNQEILNVTVFTFNRNQTNLGTTSIIVYNSFADIVPGADVRLQEYNPVTGSFAETGQAITDSNGRVTFPILLLSKSYRFYATATIDNILYDAYDVEEGSIIYLDNDEKSIYLDNIVGYSSDYGNDLIINVTNTSLIGNTSFHTVNYYDPSGLDWEVCLGYYYIDGVIEQTYTEICEVGSSGTINYDFGYTLNRSYRNVVKAFVRTTEKDVIYYEEKYAQTDGFESIFEDIVKPLILLVSLLSLGMSLQLKRIDIFLYLNIASSILWSIFAPSYVSAGGVALMIMLSMAVLFLAKKKTNAGDV